MTTTTPETYLIRPTRTYTEHQKHETLHILARHNGNCRRTARVTNIPWTTIRSWSRQMPAFYESCYNAAQSDSDGADFFAAPDPGPLVQDLTAKANLLIGAITPERIAEAKLPQIVRALAALLPRIDALRKTAAITDHRAEIDGIVGDLGYVLCLHIPDRALLHQIAADFTRITNTPPLDEADAPDPDPTPSPANDGRAPDPIPSGSPLPARNERPGEGLGVRSAPDERETSMSEMSTCTACCVNKRTQPSASSPATQNPAPATPNPRPAGRPFDADASFIGPANPGPTEDSQYPQSLGNPKTPMSEPGDMSEMSERDPSALPARRAERPEARVSGCPCCTWTMLHMDDETDPSGPGIAMSEPSNPTTHPRIPPIPIPAVNHDHSRIVGRDPETYPSRWA